MKITLEVCDNCLGVGTIPDERYGGTMPCPDCNRVPIAIRELVSGPTREIQTTFRAITLIQNLRLPYEAVFIKEQD